MNIVQECPTYIRLNDLTSDELALLKSVLAYKDLNTQYLYQQAKKNKFQYNRDPERWQAYVLSLKAKINQTALFEDDKGFYTYSGLLSKLEKLQLVDSFVNKVIYSSPKALPWEINFTPLTPYPYQKEAVEALLNTKHGTIQLPTSAGKSLCILNIIKQLGLKTLVVAPYKVIAKQLLSDFEKAFGKKYVDMYGDGKKQFKKQITVAISDSLVNLANAPDSEAKKHFQEKQLILVDEAHMISAPTVHKFAVDLCRNASYRYFVSATPERNDGRDLLLEGLIGNIVYSKEFKELANLGYLSPLKFRIFNTYSDNKYSGSNPLKIKQEHYLYNPNVLQLSAEVANVRCKLGESVLILVDELEQISYLKNHLSVPFDVASSETDCTEKIKDFNAKKNLLLIGTSAISTGANILPVETLILCMSGKSGTKYKQSLGRAARLYPGKKFCTVVDFNVQGVNQLERHFDERLNIYQVLSDDIEFIEE